MSTLDTNALLKSVSIGVAVTLVLAVITNVAGYAADPQLAFLSIACCCIGYLFFGVVGAGYALFAKQNGRPMEPGPMALGGAIAGLVSGVVMGIVNIVATLAFGTQMIVQAVTQFRTAEMPAGMMEGSLAAGLAVGLCLVLVLSAGFGAAGGAIYAAVAKNPPSAPAV